MNTTIKLSVSSVLLAGFMTGCSQQQFQGGGQQIAGGSQVAGGQQIAGGSQVSGGSQVAGGQQVAGGSQVAGDQQLAGDQQVRHTAQLQSHASTAAHSHNLVARTDVHSHTLQQQQRVYVPLPKKLQQKPPAVVMFDKPKPVAQPRVAPAPKRIHKPKPVVKHRGIGLPPAQPGQCFAKVKQPARFKNTVKRIQVSPAVNKRVKVRGPQYTWVNKRVQVRPATHRFQYVPAQYRTVTKKVLVKPAHYTWQKGKKGPVTRIDHMTGEILCRVKVPAVYRTVTQKVVARAAQRIKRHVPAVYKTIKQKKLSSPAQYRNINTPARFVNKTYRTKVSDERYLWKPIACKAPAAKQVRHAQPKKRMVSAQQQQQTAAFNREQAALKQLWIKQEAQRQREAAAKQRNITNQQRLAQQARQRQANAAQAARQQQALAAQRQRQAKQMALVAQQQRQAKQAALVAQQRKAQQLAQQSRIAQMRKTSHTQPSYAAPKVRTVSVNKAVQAKVQPAKIQVKPKATFVDNPAAPLTRENAVFRIQQALQQRGYNPGVLDGRLGPSTVKALTAFQESKNLKTGTLNKDTLRALNLVN